MVLTVDIIWSSPRLKFPSNLFHRNLLCWTGSAGSWSRPLLAAGMNPNMNQCSRWRTYRFNLNDKALWHSLNGALSLDNKKPRQTMQQEIQAAMKPSQVDWKSNRRQSRRSQVETFWGPRQIGPLCVPVVKESGEPKLLRARKSESQSCHTKDQHLKSRILIWLPFKSKGDIDEESAVNKVRQWSHSICLEAEHPQRTHFSLVKDTKSNQWRWSAGWFGSPAGASDWASNIPTPPSVLRLISMPFRFTTVNLYAI